MGTPRCPSSSVTRTLLIVSSSPSPHWWPSRASNTEGLFLHLGVGGQGLGIDLPGVNVEGEGGVVERRAGYRVSPVFTLFGGVWGVRVEGAKIGEAALGAAQVGSGEGRLTVGLTAYPFRSHRQGRRGHRGGRRRR